MGDGNTKQMPTLQVCVVFPSQKGDNRASHRVFSSPTTNSYFKNNSQRHNDGSAHLSAQKPVSFNNNWIEIFVQL